MVETGKKSCFLYRKLRANLLPRNAGVGTRHLCLSETNTLEYRKVSPNIIFKELISLVNLLRDQQSRPNPRLHPRSAVETPSETKNPLSYLIYSSSDICSPTLDKISFIILKYNLFKELISLVNLVRHLQPIHLSFLNLYQV